MSRDVLIECRASVRDKRISDSDSFTDESDNDSESSSLCGDHPDDEADD